MYDITINAFLFLAIIVLSGIVGAVLMRGLTWTKEETKEDLSESYSNLSEEYILLKVAYNEKISESYDKDAIISTLMSEKHTTIINPNWKQRIQECKEVESIMGLMQKRKYEESRVRLKELHKDLLDS